MVMGKSRRGVGLVESGVERPDQRRDLDQPLLRTGWAKEKKNGLDWESGQWKRAQIGWQGGRCSTATRFAQAGDEWIDGIDGTGEMEREKSPAKRTSERERAFQRESQPPQQSNRERQRVLGTPTVESRAAWGERTSRPASEGEFFVSVSSTSE